MPISIPIFLAVDLQALALAQYPGAATQLPPLYQGNIKDLVIMGVNPSGSFTGANYIAANLLGYTLAVTVSTTPNGEGTQTVLAQNNGLTWNAGNSQFTGALDLTWLALADVIAANSQIDATLEIELLVGAARQTIFQSTVTIFAPADAGVVVTPTPQASYLTAAQIAAQYMPQVGAPGQGFTLVSPDGNSPVHFTLGNDKTLQEN